MLDQSPLAWHAVMERTYIRMIIGVSDSVSYILTLSPLELWSI